MRRNIGFVEAYKRGYDIIATMDDDNIMYDSWGKDIVVGQTIEVDTYQANNGIFDPLSITNISENWHRGYPAELIPTRTDVKYLGKTKRKVLMQASLWDGIPDVDAMSRIITPTQDKLNVVDSFTSVNLSPFNSQNTFLAREVIPYYMVVPFLGRFDDIVGGYIAQKKFPLSLIFSKATVFQDRNQPHTRNIKDLKDEIWGYENVLSFINGKVTLPEQAQHAYDVYRRQF